MLVCSFCNQNINDEALVCPACGTPVLNREKPKQKWYYKTSFIVVAFLAVGPLALPLAWFNPAWRTRTKLAITFLTIAATILLSIALTKSIISISTYYSTISTL